DLPAATLPPLSFESRHAAWRPFFPAFSFDTIDGALREKIASAAARLSVETSDFLLACWFVLLWRFTDQSELKLWNVFDGRTHEELGPAVGLFARFLPLSCRL